MRIVRYFSCRRAQSSASPKQGFAHPSQKIILGENVKVIFDVRAAVVFGVVLGIIAGLLGRLLGRKA